MNFFRSEEHVRRFNDLHATAAGATLDAEQLWQLARAWWDTRLDPGWQPRTRDENQAILDRLGLSDPFWRLG